MFSVFGKRKQFNKNKYPIEYKILDYKPELWTPLKTALFLKSMAWGLTHRITDLEYTKILNDFGIEVIEELFPIFPLNHDPIIPKNTKFDFAPSIKNKPETIWDELLQTTIYEKGADNSFSISRKIKFQSTLSRFRRSN